MRLFQYQKSKHCSLTHKRYGCIFSLVQGKEESEIKNLRFTNLTHTQIVSDTLRAKSARIIGEMFIKMADLIEGKYPTKE